jgi:hypothetical protein
LGAQLWLMADGCLQIKIRQINCRKHQLAPPI